MKKWLIKEFQFQETGKLESNCWKMNWQFLLDMGIPVKLQRL